MAGNHSAENVFDRLYRAHHSAVLAYCLRRLAPSDAHDVVSEVFTIAWRKIEARPADDKIRSWLYGIAYRVLSHHWRGRRRRHGCWRARPG